MILLALLLQVTPVAPIEKGTGLPPPASDEAQVLAPINAMFAGLTARDPAAILAQVRPDGSATVAIERADGTRAIRRQSWADFAAGMKPGPERYVERLIGPAVEIDGDIAMVWAPYDFAIDGKVHHCGTDHFDLVREGGRWRVLNVTWTQRMTGCETR